MPFEYGAVSCRMFLVPRGLPQDAVERFAKCAAPAIDGADGEVQGWVTGRHLLDRNITDESAFYGGFLRLTHLTAQRRIPASLLAAEVRIQELAEASTQEQGGLSRKRKTEIRQSVIKRLLPRMPPQLTGMPFVYHQTSDLVYAAALSVKQADTFGIYFQHTLDLPITPLVPGALAAYLRQADTRDWPPACFSPEVTDDQGDAEAGREFLTWLWFRGETNSGWVEPDKGERVGVLVEGPLTFVREGTGAHVTQLRKGEPLLSAEAKTALLTGKKLRQAKLTFARGDRQWQCTLDADEFVFRGLRLPDTEPLEPVALFQERMRALEDFRSIFFGLYGRFLDDRTGAGWAKVRTAMKDWVKGRQGRK